MKYQFTPDLITGNDQIDAQHKTLINALNALFEACAAGKGRDELAKASQFLADYTATHFADEEKLQLACKYPDYARHKKLHEGFKDTVAKLVARLNAEGPTILLVGELNSMLASWLLNHIKKEDSKIAQHIKQSAQ